MTKKPPIRFDVEPYWYGRVDSNIGYKYHIEAEGWRLEDQVYPINMMAKLLWEKGHRARDIEVWKPTDSPAVYRPRALMFTPSGGTRRLSGCHSDIRTNPLDRQIRMTFTSTLWKMARRKRVEDVDIEGWNMIRATPWEEKEVEALLAEAIELK